MKPEKYAKVQITVTDDEGVGYHLTVWRAKDVNVRPIDDKDEYWTWDDKLIRSFVHKTDFTITFEAKADPSLDEFRNIYEIQYLPRPEAASEPDPLKEAYEELLQKYYDVKFDVYTDLRAPRSDFEYLKEVVTLLAQSAGVKIPEMKD